MASWNHILLREEYARMEPDRDVVNLVPMLEKRNARRILDLGCGAGRHIIFLAKRGFELHGVDSSKTGLEITKKRLKERELKAELINGDMKAIPYANSCFDAIICMNTIYHQRKAELQKTILEVRRILKRNGLILANFHSKRSSRYGKGIKIEEDTFVDETGPEKGIPHHYVDEEELEELLKGFRIIELRVDEEKVGDYLRSRITVVAEKVAEQKD